MPSPIPQFTKEELRERSRQQRERIRENILTLFGRKCTRCGYDRDVRALQVDHIYRTTAPRNSTARSGYGLYIRILNGTFPVSDFQLLCANCNWLKKLDNKEHSPITTSEVELLKTGPHKG
jgi:5-methylcytosine-specific restriction endonuclease McrA